MALKRSLSSQLAAATLYISLAGAPALFGSRDPTVVAAWCALLGGGLVLAPTRRLQEGHLLLLAGIALVTLCFGFIIHEQLSDRPWVAPFHPIWAEASEALGRRLAPSVSIVKGEPFFALGHSLANTLALLVGILVGVDSDRARRGVRVMAWAGGVYALYGIFVFAFDPTQILWREKTAYVGNLTATFINRNTAACYFGSCSAVWLVRLMSAVRNNLPRGPIEWWKLPGRLLRARRTDVLLRFVMLFVCLCAMFLTGSRGGVLVSLGVLTGVFMLFFKADLPRGKRFLMVLFAGAGGSLLILYLLGGNVSSRIDLYGLSDAGRLSAYRSTLRIILDNPWFGTGLGTFAYAFPLYRSDDISMLGIWDIAHNTPLELACEMGVPFALIAALAWMVALAVLSLGLSERRSTVPLSALAVSVIALLHSSIDFSLQIAGYSIVVFALLGLGLSQAVCSRDGNGGKSLVPRAVGTEPASTP
jgi:O-antigen ligase